MLSSPQNVFSLAVYHRERDRDVFNMFLCAAAGCVRGPPDEYEDPEEPTVGHCARDVRVHWNNVDWTVEDFLSLLVDADMNQRAAQYVLNPSLVASGEGEAIDYHELAMLVGNIQQQPHLRMVYSCPILSHVACRDFLKHYLFWLAVHYDSRVARLACRINNMLLSHDLGCPTPMQNVSLYETLSNILPLYARGKITGAQFREYIWSAYCFSIRPHGTQGRTSDGGEEEVEEEEEEEKEDTHCLFDTTATRFRGTASYLVIRKNALMPDALAQNYIEAHRGAGR